MVVNENHEKPKDIVEDYLEIIKYADGNDFEIKQALFQFFDDVNYWTVKQLLIDQTKVNLQNLKELEDVEHEFIDDDFDDEID